MSYSFDVVNSNYKSALGKPIDLKVIHDLVPNSTLCYKPSQLIVKDEEGTLIFFANGKYRVMGCVDELQATCLLYKYAALIDKSDNDFESVFCQSSTVRVLFHQKINLIKLAQIVHNDTMSPIAHFEREIFPAVLIRKYKPLSVNVFSTGKIMICGVRNIEQVHDIMKDLCIILDECTL
jgi:TATA-box binding protein (TBP) (component of TFIID and TFIIIB)